MTIDAGLRTRAATSRRWSGRPTAASQPTARAPGRQGRELRRGPRRRRAGRRRDPAPRAGAALLEADRSAVAQRGPIFIDRERSCRGRRAARACWPVPVRADDGARIVVVGTATEARDEALTGLRASADRRARSALLLASLAGYVVAAAALRPVEAMRRGRRRSRRRCGAAPAAARGRRRDRHLGETLNAMLDRIDARSSASAPSSPTPATSCGRRWRSSAPSWSWRSREGRTPEELRAALASAAEETDRLTQLAEDLLRSPAPSGASCRCGSRRLDLGEALERRRARFARRAADAAGGGSRSTRRPPSRSAPTVCASSRRSATSSTTPSATATGTIEPRRQGRERRCRGPRPRPRAEGFPGTFSARAFERFSRARPAIVTAVVASAWRSSRTVARAHGGEAHAGNRDWRWRRRLGDPAVSARRGVALSHLALIDGVDHRRLVALDRLLTPRTRQGFSKVPEVTA